MVWPGVAEGDTDHPLACCMQEWHTVQGNITCQPRLLHKVFCVVLLGSSEALVSLSLFPIEVADSSWNVRAACPKAPPMSIM